MSLIRAIALVALIAAAAGVDLEPLSRRAFPNDIAGVWELQSERSALCPTTVTHTTWSAGGDGSFRAPHNTILHDATRCDGGAGDAFTLYPSRLLGGASGGASAAVPAALAEIMGSATFNKHAKAARTRTARSTSSGTRAAGGSAAGPRSPRRRRRSYPPVAGRRGARRRGRAPRAHVQVPADGAAVPGRGVRLPRGGARGRRA